MILLIQSLIFFFFFLMRRPPPRSTQDRTLFPTRRSSDLRAPRRHRPPTGTGGPSGRRCRSEEHTSELQSHGLISYAVFCLKKKKKNRYKKASYIIHNIQTTMIKIDKE